MQDMTALLMLINEQICGVQVDLNGPGGAMFAA
jgi:hypothetical protein